MDIEKKFVFILAMMPVCMLFAADKYWTGASSASASLAANWCDDAALTQVSSSAPVDGDKIHLTSGSAAMTWNINDISVGSWVQDGYTGTVTFHTGKKNGRPTAIYGYTEDSGETRILKVAGDIVLNTGTWTTEQQPDNKSSYTAWKNGQGVYRLIVDALGDVTIGESGKINLKGRGFKAYQGPGSVASNQACANHAGIGSIYTSSYSTNCYGVVRDPVTLGSSSNNRGGGAVRIVCAGALHVDGTVDVSGNDASYHLGAGGSISVFAASISGSGVLSADGGKGTAGSHDRGGGGGRISVVLTGAGNDFSSFDGVMTAKVPRKSNNSSEDGAGGTIYLETLSDGTGGGVLTIDNIATDFFLMGTRAHTLLNSSIYNVSPRKIIIRKGARVKFDISELRTLPPIEFEDDEVITKDGFFQIPKTVDLNMDQFPVEIPIWLAGGTISSADSGGTYCVKDGATLYVSDSSTVNGNLRVLSGGKVTHYKDIAAKMNLHVTGDFTVDEGGSVTATGMSGSTTGKTSGKGGSYGGRARAANPVCYGSIRSPVDYGSAGYGNAGGAIRITADGAMTINGAVSANGSNVAKQTGSGGSVFLTGHSISGAGRITANGGNQTATDRESPGGGGRVAVYLTGAGQDFSGFTGQITAYGGTSRTSGYVGKVDAGAGTVYLKTADQADNAGMLVVANSNTVAYATEIMKGNVFQKADVVDSDVGEVVVDGAKLVVSNAELSVVRGMQTTPSGIFEGQENGLVKVIGADEDAYFYGTNRFWSFACDVPGKTLRFGTGAGDLLAVADGGRLSLTGNEEDSLFLRPAVSGESWALSVFASGLSFYSVEHVVVDHSDASCGGRVVAISSREDPSGSCVNWRFANASPDGDDIVWTGDNGTSWNDFDNWDMGRTPNEKDRILIPLSENYPELQSRIVLASLEVEAGARLFLAGSDLEVSDRLVVDGTLVCSASEQILVQATNIVMAGMSLVPAASTFVISGEKDQTVSADASFYDLGVQKSGGTISWSGSSAVSRNLMFSADAPSAVSFAPGSSFEAGSFHANGTVDGEAALSLAGSWALKVAKYARAYGVEIGGCDASSGSRLHATGMSVDLSGNKNCDFGSGLFVWTGEEDSDFANPANWLGGEVPGENDIVEFRTAGSLTISSPLRIGGLFLEGGTDGVTFISRASLDIAGPLYVGTNATLFLDCPATVGGYVQVDGTITHTAGETADTWKIDLRVNGDMLVSESGVVHADGKGYKTQEGPSPGFLGAGASHGGCGSHYNENVANSCYGSFVSPVTYGSGGNSGSNGGGAVKLHVDGTLSNFGVISADAMNASSYTGAGGSVYLVCSDFVGNGSVSAVGGRASQSGVYETLAGGGGRISIVKTAPGDFSGFTGDVTAYGAYHSVTELSGQKPVGGAGCVTWTQAGKNPLVIVDNKNSSNSNCVGLQLPTASHSDPARIMKTLDIHVRNKGVVTLAGDVRINDLVLESGTKLFLDGYTLRIRSRVHKDRSGWLGTVIEDGGQIIWESAGFSLCVR